METIIQKSKVLYFTKYSHKSHKGIETFVEIKNGYEFHIEISNKGKISIDIYDNARGGHYYIDTKVEQIHNIDQAKQYCEDWYLNELDIQLVSID